MGIGEDLLLVAVDHKTGQLRSWQKLGTALAAAELAELALSSHITLVGARITVVDEAASATAANGVLRVLAASPQSPAIPYWLHSRSRPAMGGCLSALKKAKVLVDAPNPRHEDNRPVSVADMARHRRATDRFAAVAHSSSAEGQVTPADLAFALLADGVGLTSELVGGLIRHKVKTRLAELAAPQHDSHEPDRTVHAIVRMARRELAQKERKHQERQSALGETWPTAVGQQWGGLPRGIGPTQ